MSKLTYVRRKKALEELNAGWRVKRARAGYVSHLVTQLRSLHPLHPLHPIEREYLASLIDGSEQLPPVKRSRLDDHDERNIIRCFERWTSPDSIKEFDEAGVPLNAKRVIQALAQGYGVSDRSIENRVYRRKQSTGENKKPR